MGRHRRSSIKVLEDFWSNFEPVDSRGCRVWKGSPTRNGYGQFWVGSRNVYVHDFSYYFHLNFPGVPWEGIPDYPSVDAFLDRLNKKLFPDPFMEVHHDCLTRSCGWWGHYRYVASIRHKTIEKVSVPVYDPDWVKRFVESEYYKKRVDAINGKRCPVCLKPREKWQTEPCEHS